MSAPRKPLRDGYDAILALGPWEGAEPTAYVLVKRTFAISHGRCEPAPPTPLLHDFRDEGQQPRLVPGMDFWPRKSSTDFVVRGAAHTPGGKPRAAMIIAARVGTTHRQIAVFGRRAIAWSPAGTPLIEDPEPFTCMPAVWSNAYGGVDYRVQPIGAVSFPQLLTAVLRYDHPGAYPRNPFGKGYFVLPGPVPGAEMPNLEDPTDLLTPDRLVSGDPGRWYRQPIPACFDWVHPLTFPRFVWFGAGTDAWFPGPDDETLPEVRLGALPSGYRAHVGDGAHPRFCQEAPFGLIIDRLHGDEPVVIEGMHPDRPVLSFRLPSPPPRVVFAVEGRPSAVAVRTHSIIVEPEEEKVSIVYGATAVLPRPFIPGVHRHIPVAVTIDGDVPISYEAPPTVRDQLAAARGRA